MAAKKGVTDAKSNDIWSVKPALGRPPKFKTPDELWEAAVEYFEWNRDNPLSEAKIVSFRGSSTIETLPKLRAMTFVAFSLFVGISLERYWSLRTRDGFERVMEDIDNIIRTQKFEGAAADLLNPNLIARDLGLAEKSEVSADVVGSVMVVPAKISPQDWVAREEAENEKRVSPEEGDGETK